LRAHRSLPRVITFDYNAVRRDSFRSGDVSRASGGLNLCRNPIYYGGNACSRKCELAPRAAACKVA
jgi:hypothetical protein